MWIAGQGQGGFCGSAERPIPASLRIGGIGRTMEINRNQYFALGLILLLLGLQFRLIESLDLTPDFTQVLAERTGHPLASVDAVAPGESPIVLAGLKKHVRPPEFLGWALLAVGATLILHSMAMRKPD